MNKTLKLVIYTLIIVFICNETFSQKKNAGKPKLIVLIVVEQMRYDYLFRYREKFDDNGFNKLTDKGFFFQNANYDYMLNYSSSGYSTIVTGSYPSMHSIVGDYWYNRLTKRLEYSVFDESANGINSENESFKMSPEKLKSTTFSDELRLSNYKKSKVFSVSANNYSAVLPGGHLANGAFAIDFENGKWESSSYYGQSLPSWVERFNEKNIADIYMEKNWDTYFNISEYFESLQDNTSYEKGFENGVKTFPYLVADIKKQFNNYEVLNYTPFGNTYIKDFAISAIVNEDLGKDDYTDFLSISFSANANISKLFSIRSVELQDMYLRLDRDLAHLITFIEQFTGDDNYLIILTSDKGATDSPKFLKDSGLPGGEFNESSGLLLLSTYLNAIYGKGEWVEYYGEQQIYLNRDLILKNKLNLEDVQQTTVDFLVNLKGVASVVSSATLQKTEFSGGISKKIQNSYNQERSADIIINLSPGWAISGSKYDKFSHKKLSAYQDDTHVPLIFYGWKVKQGKSLAQISITDIAPTLSLILDIPFPSASNGSPITKLIEGYTD